MALLLPDNRLSLLVCTHPWSISVLFVSLDNSYYQLPGSLLEWSSHFGYPLVLGDGVSLFQ